MFEVKSKVRVDLLPLEICEVQHDGVHLRLREPLRLQLLLDSEDSDFLRVEDKRFGLDAFADTVEGLAEEVAESLVVGWRNYALASDEALSKDAVELKYRLLAAMDEVSLAGQIQK